MFKHSILNRRLEAIDFQYVLPVLGRLPLPLGLVGASIRGILNYVFNYDWRSQAVGFPFVRQNTAQAFQGLRPGNKRAFYSWLTALRFVHNSREEWQAQLFPRPVMNKIKAKSTLHDFDQLLDIQKAGRGVVLVSCHLDSFCMGMVLMGMNGLTIHCVNTKDGVEDPRIHPRVTCFLKTKYKNMEQRMSGRMEYHETNMQFFYTALEKGEAVALMGDVPGSKSNIYMDFAAKKIQLPLGAWHMAVQTNSLLAGYVCLMTGVGRYEVHLLQPFEPDHSSPEGSLRPIYEFLDGHIRQRPSRWVAADLTAAYQEISGT